MARRTGAVSAACVFQRNTKIQSDVEKGFWQTVIAIRQLIRLELYRHVLWQERNLRHDERSYSSVRLSRSAFAMTETELNVIAALAIIGLSSSPKNG